MRILAIIIVLLSIPVFIAWLRTYRSHHKWAYFLIGLLPFTISVANLDAALVSWPAWTGYAKGYVLTLLDTLALAIIATHRKPFTNLPFLGLMIAYVLAAAMSVLFSSLWMSSSFYVFQLLRILILFVAVASFVGRPGAVRWLAFGLAAGAIVQALFTVDQRLSGIVQASGTMGHQNVLGLMLHFVTLPLLALLLAGERNKIVMLGVLAGLMAVALGGSRGAVGFIAVGVALLFLLSIIRRSTTHKWKMVGMGVLAMAIIVPVTVSTFAERFDTRPIYDGPDGEREAFERAAKAMWSDNPMGVGANQYVVVANSEGYSERAGVIWNYASRSAKVHNIYLLTAAEMGWLGLISLIGLTLWAVVRGLLFSFRNRRDPRGDIVMGASVAILITAVHGLWEWVFVKYYAQYVFAISLGIIAGTLRQVALERNYHRRALTRQASQIPKTYNRPALSRTSG